MTYDLIVVGAGPAGLTAGVYARSRKLETLILDAGRVGGQLIGLYPDKTIYNFPSFSIIQARKLAEKLEAHAQHMGCEIHEGESVETIEDGDEELVVRTSNGEYTARSVIIAIGMGQFKPRRLGVPGELENEGRGVYYKLPEKDRLVGKRVFMVGGGNSALEMALISCAVAKTTVCHRRDCFRADESVVDMVERSSICKVMNSNVKEIHYDDKGVKAISYIDCDGKEHRADADMVVINIGISPDLGDLKRWNLELEDDLIKAGFNMSTSRPGIFACGDVITYHGKYRQIITACGEAATACNSAYKFIKRPYWA